MNFYQSLLGITFIAASLNAQAALYSPQCPKEIKTQQQLSEPMGSWESINENIPHFLSGVSFYVGHPKEQGSLKPEFINKKQSKWDFSSQDMIYLVCQYQKTTLTLTQPLPKQTTHCLVDYNLGAKGDNGYLPEKITCLKE